MENYHNLLADNAHYMSRFKPKEKPKLPKLVCIVGLCGSGKSEVSDELVRRGYQFLRFGQITLDIVREKGLEPIEANERPIREQVRKEHGMGAYAILNIPKINGLLEKGNVVGDGLYSWDEYKILKKEYGDRFFVIAVYASPETRKKRLCNRKLEEGDTDMRRRPMTPEEVDARDYAEIENLAKGGPIARADYLLKNEGTIEELMDKVEKTIRDIESK